MFKILSLAALILILISGIAIGHEHPENPFISENDDLYFEGWYEVDSSGHLTGSLLIDIINGGTSALSQINYKAIPGFYKCSTKPINWTCQHNSKSGTLSFINQSGTFGPQDRITFKVEYKNPQTKKLTHHGSIDCNIAGMNKKILNVTRIESKP